jgi:Txe/YoeB family toxin of toxin-antitoxin system
MWKIVFTKQAQKDAKKLSRSGLRSKAEELLDILKRDPFQYPPAYEKLVGDLTGAYSRRINIVWSINCCLMNR